MKICFVGLENLSVLASEYGQNVVGGEQVQHILLARALIRRGHMVSMVVGDYGQKDGTVWDSVTTYKAYRLDAGLPILRFIHPRWTGVWSAMKRADAEVYYASCAGMHVGMIAMFCSLYKRRLVFRVASDTDTDPARLRLKYRRDKKLYKYGVCRAETILVQSKVQQEAMLLNYNRESIVAKMLVDSPRIVRRFDGRDIDVLWVSNIRQIKRPDLLLNLARIMPYVNFHMVGGLQPGESALFNAVQTMVSNLSNVFFHGALSYNETNKLYDRTKIFVNTSDIEGFPNSYLQSWIRGVPVVAFFDPDNVIREKCLGKAVASLTEMQSAINEYLSSPSCWDNDSLKCLSFMASEFEEDEIMAIYEAALNGENQGIQL